MPGGIFADVIAGGAAAGGKGLGFGMAAYAFYKLIAFVLTFIGARLDARQLVLDRQQERLDVSLGNRLAHLERTEAANRAEIAKLRECVEILASELRRADPTNSKLQEVARSLRVAFAPPRDTPDDMTDLLGRAQ